MSDVSKLENAARQKPFSRGDDEPPIKQSVFRTSFGPFLEVWNVLTCFRFSVAAIIMVMRG